MDTLEQLEAFFAGGATAAKFPDGAYGTVIGGEILDEPRMQQQRDYETNELLTYPDGNPQMQMVVTVQAQPATDDDDGRRTFYIKGQMKAAVGEALRKVGAKTLRRGGQLWIKYTEDKPVTLKNGRPGSPQKIHIAKYEPPAQTAAGQFFDTPPTTSAAPAAASADDMRSSGNTAGRKLPCPPNVPPVKWAAMTGPQQEQMYDALGMALPVGRDVAPQASRFDDEPPF